MDRRIDPLTGRPSVIVGSRQARPNLPSTSCPFCPGGLEAPEATTTSSGSPTAGPPCPTSAARWCCTPRTTTPSSGSSASTGRRKVVDLWAERTAALGARDDVDYVLVFENRGPEVGATIAHPHGQIYAFDEVPPAAARRAARRRPRRARRGRRGAGRERVERLALLGSGRRRPGPTSCCSPRTRGRRARRRRLRPRRPGDGADRRRSPDSTSSSTVPMPYMMWIHQRPTDGGSCARTRVHLHIAPLLRSPGIPRFVAVRGTRQRGVLQPGRARRRCRAAPGLPRGSVSPAHDRHERVGPGQRTRAGEPDRRPHRLHGRARAAHGDRFRTTVVGRTRRATASPSLGRGAGRGVDRAPGDGPVGGGACLGALRRRRRRRARRSRRSASTLGRARSGRIGHLHHPRRCRALLQRRARGRGRAGARRHRRPRRAGPPLPAPPSSAPVGVPCGIMDQLASPPAGRVTHC